jgi:hypothetical protein
MPPKKSPSSSDQDDLDPVVARSEGHVSLGKYQSHITTDIGFSGRTNGVVLVFGIRSKDQLLHSECSAGAAVGHMSHGLLTAYHCVDDTLHGIKKWSKGRVEVWAMRAADYDGLDQADKDAFSVVTAKRKGAVQAKGYRSLAAEGRMIHAEENTGKNRCPFSSHLVLHCLALRT